MYTYKPAKKNTEKTESHVLAKSSPLYTQPSMQKMADNGAINLNADKLVQRKGNALLEDYLSRQAVAQREEVPEEEELLQGKFSKPNKTGLPDTLKSGIENLSGHSMDNVRVHHNSPKPAQLQALAYTQGTNIHIAPGQEKHLPHEAWHVVQQMQGRVQPTKQLQGVNINDNEGLEREADVMGLGAIQCITQGQHDFLKKNPISKQKLNRCDASGLLTLLSRYMDYYPGYLKMGQESDSLRTSIEEMRAWFKVPIPIGWEQVLKQVSSHAPKRIQTGSNAKREYAYGSANTIPHIHCYPSGAHIKILVGKKIKRLDIVKNGFLANNIDYIKELAANNKELFDAINKVIGQ